MVPSRDARFNLNLMNERHPFDYLDTSHIDLGGWEVGLGRLRLLYKALDLPTNVLLSSSTSQDSKKMQPQF